MVTTSSLAGWSVPLPGAMTLVARPDAVLVASAGGAATSGRRGDGRRRAVSAPTRRPRRRTNTRDRKNAHAAILPVVSSAPYLAGQPSHRTAGLALPALVLAEVADVGISEHTKGVPMPQFTKLTPNLLVASVERSLAFYVDTLGFERGMTVPDAVAVRVRVGDRRPGRDLLQRRRRRGEGVSGFAGKPIGATGTLFIEVEGRRRAARSAEADA